MIEPGKITNSFLETRKIPEPNKNILTLPLLHNFLAPSSKSTGYRKAEEKEKGHVWKTRWSVKRTRSRKGEMEHKMHSPMEKKIP